MKFINSSIVDVISPTVFDKCHRFITPWIRESIISAKELEDRGERISPLSLPLSISFKSKLSISSRKIAN